MISGAFKAFSGFFLVKWSKENKYIKKSANKQRRRDQTPGTGHRALGTRHTPTEFASTPRSKPAIRQVHLLGSARPSPQVRVRRPPGHGFAESSRRLYSTSPSAGFGHAESSGSGSSTARSWVRCNVFVVRPSHLASPSYVLFFQLFGLEDLRRFQDGK